MSYFSCWRELSDAFISNLSAYTKAVELLSGYHMPACPYLVLGQSLYSHPKIPFTHQSFV